MAFCTAPPTQINWKMEPIFGEITKELKKIEDVTAPIMNMTKQGTPVTGADVINKTNKANMGEMIINLVNQLNSNLALLKKCASNVEILQIKMTTVNTKLNTTNEKLQESLMKQCLTSDSLKNMIKTEMDSIIPEMVKQIGTEVVKGCSSNTNGITQPLENEAKHQEKYELVLEQKNQDGNPESFTKSQWSDIVKGSVSEKLGTVQVTRTLLTSEGKGIITLPNKQSRDIAAEALQEQFVVKEEDRKPNTLLPKMNFCNLDGFTKHDKDKLKSKIPKKKPKIQSLVDSGATLEVIFIREPKDTESYDRYAVIRVDPKIREEIIKNQRRLYMDANSFYVKDQIHVIQCFDCQKYGHKKGSKYCSLKDSTGKICLYCAKKHETGSTVGSGSRSCDVKNNHNEHQCSNCRDTQRYRHAANHTSTSRECPILNREVDNVIRRTICDTKNFPIQRVDNLIQP